VQKYYIRPEEQIAQLRLAGFEQVRILAPDGAEVTDRVSDGLSQYWWLYYLTKKSG
jgi:hypothetical protein